VQACWNRPWSIAYVTLWRTSHSPASASRFITGAGLPVDGGMGM
jgi:hypothetical protein